MGATEAADARGGRPPVPETLESALSPEWLTAALGTRFPGVVVRDVVPGPVVSRMTTNARFRIECEGSVPEALPLDLCVKGYFSDLGRMARASGLPEAIFYRDVVGSTGVRTLPPVYADVDAETRYCVIITEDVVVRGATFLDTLSEYGPDDTALSLEQFAALHSSTWMSPHLRDVAWFDPWFADLPKIRGVAAIQGNFEGPIGAGVPERVRDAERLFEVFSRVADEAMTASPWCLVHGDAHMANLFLDGEGRPCLVDWQLVQRGPWYLDVGYHLAATLGVEARRASERDLVRHYLDHLRAGGVDAPTEDEAWNLITRGMVHGLYLWGITIVVDPHITTSLLERLGTAVDDHDAYDR